MNDVMTDQQLYQVEASLSLSLPLLVCVCRHSRLLPRVFVLKPPSAGKIDDHRRRSLPLEAYYSPRRPPERPTDRPGSAWLATDRDRSTDERKDGKNLGKREG